MEESNYPRPNLIPAKPWWVRVTMVGLRTRASVLAFGWISIGLAIACLIAGFFYPRAFIGTLLFIAAWPYFATVRWMDANRAWR